MRAYHEVGPLDRVQVKTWPCGTPCVLMYGFGRTYPRDIQLSPQEVLDLGHEIGLKQAFEYLLSLQQMLDRTNGVKSG